MQVENIEFSCQVPQPIKRVYVPSSRQYHTTTRFGFILRFSLVPSFEGLYFYMDLCLVQFPFKLYHAAYRCHHQGDGLSNWNFKQISRSYCQGGWELPVDISTGQASTFTIISFSLSRQSKSQSRLLSYPHRCRRPSRRQFFRLQKATLYSEPQPTLLPPCSSLKFLLELSLPSWLPNVSFFLHNLSVLRLIIIFAFSCCCGLRQDLHRPRRRLL